MAKYRVINSCSDAWPEVYCRFETASHDEAKRIFRKEYGNRAWDDLKLVFVAQEEKLEDIGFLEKQSK